MAILNLYSNGALKITGIGVIDAKHEFAIVEIQMTSAGSTATLRLAQALGVPEELIVPGGAGEYDLAPLPNVVDAKLVKLREALRQRLNRDLAVSIAGADTFFGVSTIYQQQLSGSVRLELPWLSESAHVVLSAKASAAIQVALPGLTINASMGIIVRIEGNLPRLEFEFSSLQLPTFHLPIPECDFPAFSWAIQLPFAPCLPSFWLPTFPLFDQLTFAWAPPPALAVTLTGSDLTVVAGPATGFFSDAAGNQILGITNFGLQSVTGQPLTLTGTLTLPGTERTVFEEKTVEDGLPVAIRLRHVTVLLPATITPGTPVELYLKVARLEVQSKSDPALVVAVQANLKIVIQPNGTYSSAIDYLKLLEPTDLELIAHAVEFFESQCLRIAIPCDFRGPNAAALVVFLERVVRILQSAVVWMVQEVDSAARAIAGLAESVLQLVGQLIEKLSELARAVYQEVTIEIRLDPRTYQLRQVILTPRTFLTTNETFSGDFAGISIEADARFKPALVLDFTENEWFGIALLSDGQDNVTIGTDLWLARETTPAQPIKKLDSASGSGAGKAGRLIELKAESQRNVAFVPIAFERGRLKLFQATDYKNQTHGWTWFTLAETTKLRDVSVDDVTVTCQTQGLVDRILDLLPKPKPSGGGGSFLDSLENYVRIKSVTPTVDVPLRTVTLKLTIEINLKDNFKPEADLELKLHLDTFKADVTGGDRISIRSTSQLKQNLLGMDFTVDPTIPPPKSPDGSVPPFEFESFYLDLRGGRQEFGLGDDAKATLGITSLSSAGGGLKFGVSKFNISRGGLNLSAATIDDPVTLGGVNMPFRFKNGSLDIVDSKFAGASLSGAGQLPPALMGEANASIALRLREKGGRVVVESAEANLDKGEDPIVCNATRFRFTIRKLGMAFETEQQGDRERYHFYFLLTGSAQFQPIGGEFASGLLKNLKDLEIVLDRAPLTGDGRLLKDRVSFQVKVDPPKKSKFFDLFEFELRGVGLHPSVPEFGGMPAMSISGQVNFTEAFDKVRPTFRFHELWIAPPKPQDVLPQIRFDGLTVGLDLKGMGQVEGTAIAVDGTLPKSLYRPEILPANVTANGFLAAGKLAIQGWASMSASMGFLELQGGGEKRLAYFLYIQKNELSEAIPTPVGTIYLREVGFGFGWRYTLAGIAAAETVSTPQALVKVLDEVSKVQGDLHKIEAWTPTPDQAHLTLAMRALFSVTSASSPSSYNETAESELPNPLLFDVVAAIRSDLTFLMNVRLWIGVNYADWHALNFSGSSRPSLRGYLYLSVPKQTFLARLVGDPKGFVGDHPPLPDVLKKALSSVSYSSTLFICPGLFHFEMGWPYELSVDIGDPNGNFHLRCQGGMVFRIEDGAALYGFALRASGFAQIGGSTGGSFGAAAYARADFSLEGKLLSYISVRSPGESMFYASFRVDIHVRVSVRVWLEFSVFGHDFHWEMGFSFGVTVALALELAVLLNDGLGARIYAAVGVQGFGRSLTLGIELKFGESVLDAARARVERFLSVGLGTSVPANESVSHPAAAAARPPAENEPLSQPPIESSRGKRAQLTDERISETNKEAPPAAPIPLPSENIWPADFWAMLFPIAGSQDDYVLQLLPKDLTGISHDFAHPGSFFGPCGPQPAVTNAHLLELGTATVKAIRRLDASEFTVSPVSGSEPCPLQGQAVIYSNSVPLHALWQECFQKQGEVVWDPPPVLWEPKRQAIHADPQYAARQLTDASRRRATLSAADRKTAEIEERRSSVISLVADSARTFANGITGNAVSGWQLPARGPVPGLHCVDLGLTFLVTGTEIEQLFDKPSNPDKPRQTAIKIKRSRGGGNWTTAGDIFLHNPPERMFRKSNPRLFGINHLSGDGGVSLLWDLEPSWGRSATAHAYSDPEFHVLHYRIVRTISDAGSEEEWPAEFETKAAAPVDALGVLFAPPVQFQDDFTQPPGFDPDLRNRILGKDRNTGDIQIHYAIYPIDNAGTVGEPQEYDVPIAEADRVLDVPRDPSIRFDFEDRRLAGPGEVSTATISVELRLKEAEQRKDGSKPPTLEEYLAAMDPVYDLWVAVDRPTPSGQYGADALSTALGDAGPRRIDLIPAKHQFELTKSTSGNDVAVTFLRRGRDGKDEHLTINYKVRSAAGTNFRTLCGLGNGVPPRAQTLTFYLRTAKVKSPEYKLSPPSAWRKARVEIMMGHVKETEKNIALPYPPIEATLEEFELPLNLRFDPIHRVNRRTLEVGRLHLLVPQKNSNAEQFGFNTQALTRMIDPKRRTGIRLRWQASPASLALSPAVPLPAGADPWRWVSGFHVLELKGKSAERVASVNLIPNSAAGREPAEFGDVSLIESAYPSLHARSESPFGWFSAAESEPVFPALIERRSLMPSIDEALLASLFSEGNPHKIKCVVDKQEFSLGQEPAGPITITTARSLLQKQMLPENIKPIDGMPIEILALDAENEKLARQTWNFDARSQMHPALADALDLMQYDTYSSSPGEIYRRYEVVHEPSPSRTSPKFEAFLDETPLKRDPYGWTILRSLGLAAAFRLYDTEEGSFLTGGALVAHVREKFDDAIARYSDQNIGSPFLDLVTLPWETARPSSFDNGAGNGDETGAKVSDQLLSSIQISLRPRVSALVQGRRSAVAYYKVSASAAIDVDHAVAQINPAVEPQIECVDILNLVDPAAGPTPIRLTRAETRKLALKITSGMDLVFWLRVVFKDPIPVTPVANPLLFGSIGALTTNLIPTEPAILGRFPDLDPETLEKRLTSDDSSPATAMFDWALRCGFTKPSKDKPSEDKAYKALCARLPVWWQRFLDHCDPNSSNDHDRTIRFSLGTLAMPGTYRVPVAEDGTVGVFLLEESQYGKIREFAIQPYSRYRSFADALNQTLGTPAAAAVPVSQRFQVTIPRIAPVAKPTILSAKRVPTSAAQSTLELVVARTPDEIISSANQTTERGLASAGVSVGFWREFAHTPWGKLILGEDANLNPVFGSGTIPNALALTLTSDQLPEFQKRIPDAWLGARVYRFSSLPYFYRIHALTYANAGVVISPPSVTSFVDGVVHADKSSPNKPTYFVTLHNGQLQIRFYVPLTAFEDCMMEPELWDVPAPEYRKLVRLPDPAIAYRIALIASARGTSTEALSLEPQIDLLASPPNGGGDPYVVQTIGSRFQYSSAVPLPRVGVEPDGNERWKVSLKTSIAGLAPAEFVPFSFNGEPGCAPVPLTDPAELRTWVNAAPQRQRTFEYRAPAGEPDRVNVSTYCAEQIAFFGQAGLSHHPLVELLDQIRQAPAAPIPVTPLPWLLGMPEVAFNASDGTSLLLLGPLTGAPGYNPNVGGALAQRDLIARVFPDPDCVPFVQDYGRALLRHWVANRPPLRLRNVSKDEFDQLTGHLDAPGLFPSIDATVTHSIRGPGPGGTAADFHELCKLLEDATAGGPALAALETTTPRRIQLPRTATPRAFELVNLFFALEDPEPTDPAWHITLTGLPDSDTWHALQPIPPQMRDLYREMIEEIWFGSQRRPVLLASRGANPPLQSEIKGDVA